jgi:putative phage-type endonuclease
MATMSASKVAAVLGISPYTGPFTLWQQMAGNVPPEGDSMAFRRGHYLEPAVAAWFADEHPDWTIATTGTWTSATNPRHMASPDRLVHLAPGKIDPTTTELLEIKSTVKGYEWGTPGTDQVPDYYWVQALWQLDVTGLDRCHFGVIGPFLEFTAYVVDYDPVAAKIIRDEVDAFLTSLDARTPPPIDLHPGSLGTVQAMNPGLTGDIVEIPVTIAKTYAAARQAAKDAAAAETAAKALVGDHIGEAKAGACHGITVVTRRPAKAGANPSIYPGQQLDAVLALSDDPTTEVVAAESPLVTQLEATLAQESMAAALREANESWAADEAMLTGAPAGDPLSAAVAEADAADAPRRQALIDAATAAQDAGASGPTPSAPGQGEVANPPATSPTDPTHISTTLATLADQLLHKRRTWMLERFTAVAHIEGAQTYTAHHWPTNVPTNPDAWTHDHIGALIELADHLETFGDAAYPPPDPAAPNAAATIAAHATALPAPPAEPARPDEGTWIDRAYTTQLLERANQLTDTAKATAKTWTDEAAGHHAAFGTIDPGTGRWSQRCLAINTAIVELVTAIDDEHELVDASTRQLLSHTLGTDLRADWPTGAVLGSLTIAQAQLLANLATGFAQGDEQATALVAAAFTRAA